MPNIDDQTLQFSIVAVSALAVLFQAIVLLGIFLTLRKTTSSLKEQIDDLRSSILPILANTRELVDRVAPKIESAADDLAEITHSLRVQTEDVQSSATEIIARLRRQMSRVDSMLTSVLDTVDRAGGFMTEAISKPMRQLSGVLASIKAIVESLRESEAAHPQPTHAPGDKDMFV